MKISQPKLICPKHKAEVKYQEVRDEQKPYCPTCFKWNIFKKLGYKAYHKEVIRFHNSNARVKVCSAPRRTSKSYSAGYEAIPILMQPNTTVWVVGPNYNLAEKEFSVIHEAMVINRDKLGLPKPSVCLTNPRSGQLYIKWPWGAKLEGKSADNPNSLLGEATDAVIYSEAAQIKRAIRERYTKQTTITRKGIEIIPSTPLGGAEWMFELDQMGRQPEYANRIESFHWDWTANPSYPKEEMTEAIKIYGVNHPMIREQYFGEWVFYGGLVYPVFDMDLHVVDHFEIPDSWKKIRSIDFGHRDPFSCHWTAVGPHGELYIYREYYNREGRPLPIHISKIHALSSGEHISYTVGDSSEKQAINDMCYHGLTCISGDRDKTSGRLRVLEYLQPTDDGPKPWTLKDTETTNTRWPRMYISKECPELIREIKYYRFKESKKREGDREDTEGESHALDEIRYMCKTRPAPFRLRKKTSYFSFDGFKDRARESRLYRKFNG